MSETGKPQTSGQGGVTTQIAVGNLYCRVVAMPPELESQLGDWLAIRAKNYWFNRAYRQGHWDGYHRLYQPV